MTLQEAKEKLAIKDQNHVLKFFDELTQNEQAALLEQIESIDLSVLEAMGDVDATKQRGEIRPIDVKTIPEIQAHEATFRRIGIDAIRRGKVAAVLLAGGMGSRLGSKEPKGMFNIGIRKERSIFQCLFENLMQVVKQTGVWIHLYVMTSENNHDATIYFLYRHQFFGYDPAHLHFFKQSLSISTDYEGKIFLENKGRIATSPNGNGGWYASLHKAGFIDQIHEQGIEWFNVFSVDNVIQRIADPCFVGATIEASVPVGAKVIAKNARDERLGVMCLEDGLPSIVEYYDLSDEMMDARGADGEWLYRFGVILNYLFRESDLSRIYQQSLPTHVVNKKIRHIDSHGNPVEPTEPNGYRYETLVLDMIRLLGSCLPYEVVREKEFAPVKNPSGVDSVETARELLKQNGVDI
jgi:UDP-N-acetylglucosamine/UDP-N-acetylgalactosamine diphosphorylase